MRKWIGRVRADLLITLAFLILPLALFWNVTIGGQTMLPLDNLFQWQPWASYAAQFGISTPHNNLLSDLILENYVWKRFALSSLRSGEIPLWSPYLFAGAPFLANGQHSLYYPFSLIFFVLPLPSAFGWFTIGQLWLAAVCAYVFGRVLRLPRPAALVAGVIYQGCGFMLVSAAVFPMILAASVWLPLLLACIEMVIRVTTHRRGAGFAMPWASLGALALGLQILAGHPEITYYTLLIMALFALWRLVGRFTNAVNRRENPAGDNLLRRLVKPAVWLLVMVSVGMMLGAIQLIPQIALAQSNFREGGASLAEIRGWAFPLRRVLTLLLPNFYGNPAHHAYWDLFSGERALFDLNYYGNPNPHGAQSSSWGIKNYVEGGIYFGILPLLLALLGAGGGMLRQRLPRSNRLIAALLAPSTFFVLLALAALNFIFGSPLYAVLYQLPFINQLHSPFRWIFALSISVAMLAAYGVTLLLRVRRPTLIDRGAPLLGRLALAGGGVLLLLALLSRLLFGTLRPRLQQIFLGLAQAPDAFASVEQFYSYVLPQIVVLGLLLLGSGLLLLGSRRPAIWRWALLLFLLIAVDLYAANRNFHAAADPTLLDFEPQLVSWLNEQPGLWRITTFAPKDKPFNANSGWLFDLQDVRGYDSIISRQYVDYMRLIEPQTELPFNRVQPIKQIEALNSPLLDLLNVKYIITSETLALPKLQQVWQGEGLRVYENLAVLPRAFTLPASAATQATDDAASAVLIDWRYVLFVDDDNIAQREPQPATPQPAQITHYGNVELLIDVQIDSPSWLVVSDSYARGWRAFARQGEEEEQELPLVRANGNFRAVPLQAGEWTVRLRYSPRSFIIGGLTSFMAVVLILFGFSVWAWRRFYQPLGELTNTQSIAKNSVVPMALNLFNKAIDFAFAAFYLRLLGPSDSGAYATAVSIALWFDIIANWGLNALIIRDVSQNRSAAGRYLFNTSLLRLLTMLLGLIPVLLFVGESALSGEAIDQDVFLAIVLITIGMIFSGISQGIAGVFYAFESAEYPATLTTVTTILKVAFGVFVLLFGFGFVGLAGVSIVVNVITMLLLGYVAFQRFPLAQGWQLDWRLQRSAFRAGWPLMLNHLLATIFFKIDQPLLYRLDSEQAVGWYNSAYKWVDGFNVIPSFFTFALFPIISRQVTSDIASARRTYRMAVKLLLLIALPLAATVTLLADVMIGTLGGDAFLPDGAIALRLVIWSIPIGWINSVTNYMIVSLGLERRLTFGFFVGVLFNSIGNILLIPILSYQGAAITTILSELLLLLLFNLYLRRRMEPVDWGPLLWRPLLLTVLLLPTMMLVGQFSLPLALLVGIAIYLLGLWRLKIVGEEERAIVATIVPAGLAARLRLI